MPVLGEAPMLKWSEKWSLWSLKLSISLIMVGGIPFTNGMYSRASEVLCELKASAASLAPTNVFPLKVSFSLCGLFVRTQDQYSNMPYASWELLPQGTNHTLFTIEGGISTFTVKLQVILCQHDMYIHDMLHLHNTPMHVSYIQLCLLKSKSYRLKAHS